MDGDSVVSVNDVGADRRRDAVGGIGSGDRTFAWRTCLVDIAPDTTAVAAGIDPRARGTVEASSARRNFLFCKTLVGEIAARCCTERVFPSTFSRARASRGSQSRRSHAPSLGCAVRVGRESVRRSVGGSFEARRARLGVGDRRDAYNERTRC